jgi:hypothetical protein
MEIDNFCLSATQKMTGAEMYLLADVRKFDVTIIRNRFSLNCA